MAPSCFEVILVGFILVLPFLYETSRTFRYYFKFLIYYGGVMVISAVLMPIFWFRPGNVKNFLLVAPQSIDIIYVITYYLLFRLCFRFSPPRPTTTTFDAFLARFVFLVQQSFDSRRGGDRENLLTDVRCLFCQWVAVMMMVVFVVVAASTVTSDDDAGEGEGGKDLNLLCPRRRAIREKMSLFP